MTAPASLATTAGNYTLLFSGSVVGTWVENYKSTHARLTAVQPRTSFWSTQTLLDGSYPALVHTHDFVVYMEASTRETFIGSFHGLSDKHTGTAYPLAIVSNYTPVTTIYFGLCYMSESPVLKQPENLLMQSAGFVSLRFIGNIKPTVT